MSLETVKTISEAEQRADQAKAQAAEICKQQVAQAEAQASQAVAEAKEKARAEAAQLQQTAEQALRSQLQDLAEKTENKKAAIRARAEKHLDEAADLIAGRILKF